MTAIGWLLSLNTQPLNDCCDHEQTVKNIPGAFLYLTLYVASAFTHRRMALRKCMRLPPMLNGGPS